MNDGHYIAFFCHGRCSDFVVLGKDTSVVNGSDKLSLVHKKCGNSLLEIESGKIVFTNTLSGEMINADNITKIHTISNEDLEDCPLKRRDIYMEDSVGSWFVGIFRTEDEDDGYDYSDDEDYTDEE